MEPSTRRVVTRSPSRTVRILNLRGLLPRPVEAESSLEADYVRRAALMPTTRDLIHQPFVLPVSPKGYTPDFFHTFESADQKIVVEIKPEKKVAQYGDLFDRAAEYLLEKGYSFYVLTDQTLRHQGIHERALFIRRYAKANFPIEERKRVLSLLAEYPGGLPIGSLLRKAKVVRELVLHLMAWKEAVTGPRLKVDDSAVVALEKFASKTHARPFERWFSVKPWGITQ